ncbi:hypothetical protein BT63DRAFT_420341 [Microthyrium microscopicum]|uniref:Nucleoside transporter family n=1 Tax=Microthyrium microscopicum TaxID=703497 RepID=A0A6A6UVV9_9PEZI|nr:hypothetical protein BT63DRAFT_420341 [Microthyrium microscopicum]
MERIKDLFRSPKVAYDPLDETADHEGDALMQGDGDDGLLNSQIQDEREVVVTPFSWVDYVVFMLLGVAMLWAWNMFLAAGPYFQSRFQGNEWLLANFQSAELTVSTVANLVSMIVLANMQANASYPRRIIIGLLINIGIFTLLALSTLAFLGVSQLRYFWFLMCVILVSSTATGLLQNGIFAFMAGYGREEYAQGNMTGQAIAGVLPCIVQIISVLSVPKVNSTEEAVHEASKSATVYFLTASGISIITLLAFSLLLIRDRSRLSNSALLNASTEDTARPPKKRVSLALLYRKTFFLSTSVFITFAIAMFFPVFTQRIQSVHSPDNIPRILEPTSFIPLAFLIWNSGDLIGRVISAVPSLRITHRPHLVLTLALARILLIPLYYLCNTDGKGAVISSDWFYFLVQITYGVTNGFMGTMCMMGAVEYVDVAEREATGAFMTLMLVGGLTAGSILSFLLA